MSRAQPRSSPVDLRPGDEFKTPFGAIDILDVGEDEYLIHDPETGEETWLDFDVLVRISSANCYTYDHGAVE